MRDVIVLLACALWSQSSVPAYGVSRCRKMGTEPASTSRREHTNKAVMATLRELDEEAGSCDCELMLSDLVNYQVEFCFVKIFY